MNKSLVRLLALLLLAVFAAAPAFAAKKEKQLQESMDAYATALRWSNFDQAQQFVDPVYRQAHPLSGLELQRYAQLEISGYGDQGMVQAPDGDVVRNVELRVINRHTQVERIVHCVERWHYDADAGRWWQIGGLPDLWQGE